jgi:hypothetical protein
MQRNLQRRVGCRALLPRQDGEQGNVYNRPAELAGSSQPT